MYSKVINPEKDGKVAFSNKGSALRLGNYLEKELDVETNPEGKIFFNNHGDFTKEEMVAALDNNVKGLTAQDDKFYSLVLSPSQAELEHIGNDTQKLRAFTLACMENYAQNFQLKTRNGVTRNLTEKDLVWFANIEHDRTYKGDDPEVKSGVKKQGEAKEGLQTHIHITVSARDAGMKITLNPRTNDKNRFSILAFAEKNQKTFNEAFGYEGSQKISFKNENKQGWNKVMAVEKQLITFEEKYGLPSSDCHHLRCLAIEKEYSPDFRTKLREVGQELKKNGAANGLSEQQWASLKQSEEQTPSPSFDLIASMQRSYQFFKGAEMSESDMQEMENSLHRAGSHLKKRVKRQQQHLPQSPEKGMSL